MALRGLWKLKGKVELDARVVVANYAGGKRQGSYTALVEIQDPEGEVVLDTTNINAPYVAGVAGDRLCYWTLQYQNPKLAPDQEGVGDPPKELIQALQAAAAAAEAARKAGEAALVAQRTAQESVLADAALASLNAAPAAGE